MLEISGEVVGWFQRFPASLWAVACFQGVRYGHFSLGITELLHGWAMDGHELPVVQLMERIRVQLQGWFEERRNLGISWASSYLVPSAEKLVAEAVADSRCYQLLRANKVEFEIVSSERTNIVDIQSHCCSCRRWQIYGVPCAHAAAALISSGEDVRLYVSECFGMEKYLETYSQGIYDVPERSQWKDTAMLAAAAEHEDGGGGGARFDAVIGPPKIRRPPGRPKKKLLRVDNLKRPRRVVQCGRCHLLGHSQKKCTLPV